LSLFSTLAGARIGLFAKAIAYILDVLDLLVRIAAAHFLYDKLRFHAHLCHALSGSGGSL